MTLPVDRLRCNECGARFDFAESIGTSSRYVEHCPACGRGPRAFDVETVDLGVETPDDDLPDAPEPEEWIAVEFRERQPGDPADPPRSLRPEIDPGETGARCEVCGYWGIVDEGAALPALANDGEPRLACDECVDRDLDRRDDVEVERRGLD